MFLLIDYNFLKAFIFTLNLNLDLKVKLVDKLKIKTKIKKCKKYVLVIIFLVKLLERGPLLKSNVYYIVNFDRSATRLNGNESSCKNNKQEENENKKYDI